jgi:hypothetical protein
MPQIPALDELTNKEDEKKKLGLYLDSNGKTKDVFGANLLNARQQASETPLGKLFGMSGLTDKEKAQYAANSDPDVEAAIGRGQQMGMMAGMASPTSAIGGLEAMGAKQLGQGLASEARQIGTGTAGPLHELPALIAQKEALYNQSTGKVAQKLAQEITRLKNYSFKFQGK